MVGIESYHTPRNVGAIRINKADSLGQGCGKRARGTVCYIYIHIPADPIVGPEESGEEQHTLGHSKPKQTRETQNNVKTIKKKVCCTSLGHPPVK